MDAHIRLNFITLIERVSGEFIWHHKCKELTKSSPPDDCCMENINFKVRGRGSLNSFSPSLHCIIFFNCIFHKNKTWRVGHYEGTGKKRHGNSSSTIICCGLGIFLLSKIAISMWINGVKMVSLHIVDLVFWFGLCELITKLKCCLLTCDRRWSGPFVYIQQGDGWTY